VTLLGTDNDNPYLCAYFVNKNDQDCALIKSFAMKQLPPHMVPLRYMQLSRFPVTTNGKIDVKALPKPEIVIEFNHIEPENEFQKKLIDIWNEVLKIDHGKISIDHNFFDLGGNSIKLMQVHYKINQIPGKKITMESLFSYHTIRTLGKFLNEGSEKELDTSTIANRIGQGKKYRSEKFGSKFKPDSRL